MPTIFSILLSLVISQVSFAEEKTIVRKPGDEATALLGGLFCVGVGVPVCAIFADSKEKSFSRPFSQWAGNLSYLPSFNANYGFGAGYQRLEAQGFVSNIMTMVEERRGFEKFDDGFRSRSVRLAYSFDYRDSLPAIGLGFREVQGGLNNRAVELWLPVYSNSKKKWRDGRDKNGIVQMHTIWVFGNKRFRPELMVRYDHRIKDGFFLSGSLGYFSEYPHADIELSLGPSIFF